MSDIKLYCVIIGLEKRSFITDDSLLKDYKLKFTGKMIWKHVRHFENL